MFDNNSNGENSPVPQSDNGGGLIPLSRNENGGPTISSLEIAELLGARHDNVKRCIERLVKGGIITLPPMEEVSNPGAGPKFIAAYLVGKRDSFVVVAQLSPEFTARLVDRWQELEAQLARQSNPGGLKPFREQSRDEIIDTVGVLYEVAKEERRLRLDQEETTKFYKDITKGQADTNLQALIVIDGKDRVIEEKNRELAAKDYLLEVQQGKAKVYDLIANAEGLITMLALSKIIGLGRTTMMKLMRRYSLLMSTKEEWNLPYQRDDQYFKVKVILVLKGHYWDPVPTTMGTQKSIAFMTDWRAGLTDEEIEEANKDDAELPKKPRKPRVKKPKPPTP